MSGGTDKRTEILPSKAPEETGFLLPTYDFGANVPRPAQIGVKRGDNMSDVMNAAKGVAFYSDMIAFGEPSTGFTTGMRDKFRLLGLNFFMKTGLTCDNGADMYMYFDGTPRGDALGPYMQKAMSEMGMPALKGLAPGMLEDAKSAMNVKELVNTVFGTIYPKCVQVTKPVGDSKGQLKDPETGDVWISGPVQYGPNNQPQQTRWVQATDGRGDPIFQSREQWDKTPKIYNPDGSIRVNPTSTKEGFTNQKKESLMIALVLFGLAYACVAK